MNRRTFIKQAALTSAAAAGAVTGVRDLKAIEPVTRAITEPKYKFTLAGYSYRKLVTGKTPECTLEDFVRDCAKFGLEGTEPTSYYFPQPVTSEYLCRLKGLQICRDMNQRYKSEHIEEALTDHETVSFYRQGEFLDLCRGPHVPAADEQLAIALRQGNDRFDQVSISRIGQ